MNKNAIDNKNGTIENSIIKQIENDNHIENHTHYYNDNSNPAKLTSHFPDLGGVEVVGRDEVVDEIHKNFEKHNRLVLHGQGGIGKTVCSLYYAREHQNDYDLIRHMSFNSDVKTTIVGGCPLNDVGFEKLTPDEKFAAVKQYLEGLDTETLLMIDINEGEPTDFENLPQNRNIKILFTVRNEEFSGYKKIPIGFLSYEKLKEIFVNNSDEIKEDEEVYLAEIINKILLKNTMVIALAARAKVKSHKSMKELRDILVDDKLGKKVKEKIHHDNKIDKLTEHILRLFSISGLDGELSEVLSYVSLIDYDGVKSELFMKWYGLEDYDALNELKIGGWLDFGKDDDGDETVSMHPVISDAVFAQSGLDSVKCEKFLDNIFEEFNEQTAYKYFHLIRISEFIIGRFNEEETEEIGYICNQTGYLYKTQGNYEESLEYYSKALKICGKVFGEDHPYTATSYNNIGFVYDSMGDYEKAFEYYFKALKIDEKVLGKNHPSIAISYNNIGLVYKEKGDYDKALEYYFKSLKIREKVLGKDHPDTATSYNNIGAVYNYIGNCDKALEYYFKALKIVKTKLGENHPNTAGLYNNIGSVYNCMSDYNKALEYHFKALEIIEKVLGKEHPYTASSYNNIGAVYNNMNNYDKALEYLNKALKIRENKLGKNHPDTKETYENIAVTYLDLGDEENAIKYDRLAGYDV
ncbi:MAG: tetratricopeptide repeat protein [Oscillospiraceae bacterium]|jgi:tetratricopeptide (TPR) repeat protein|nr:tetratricopeptide repeat protein [Oscillospiraceae bacterium]